jgi:hypothetical protein
LARGTVWVTAAWDLARAACRALFGTRRDIPNQNDERPSLMLSSDLSYTFRWLARQKLSTSLVIAMLSLGIAANIVVFSLVNALF